MFLQVSVILFTGGGVGPGGGPGPGGRGAWSQGGLVWGGSGPGAVPAPRGVPGGDPPPMATAAGGTHPTGMHSCYS